MVIIPIKFEVNEWRLLSTSPYWFILSCFFFEQTMYIHHMMSKFPVFFLEINVYRRNNLVTSVNEASLVTIKVCAECI